ncbi:MAG TPA: hypothetical protein VFE47_14680 [Tepidisphaeraceae bacterium]|nr:hypothetical protein [Tepidisphaeraceae bacterium]
MPIMTTLQISLPENLKYFVEDQATKSGYGSTSAYLEALLEEVRRAQSGVPIETSLLAGLDSGIPVEADDAYWTKFRARYRERLGRGTT